MTLKVTQSRSSEMAQYPLEFHWDVWHQKTRVPQLSCDVVCVMTCLSVSIDHQLVIDRWMDRQTEGHQATAYVALAQHCAVTIWTSIVQGCDRDELANQVDCRPTQNPAVRDHADCRQFVTRVTYQSVAGNLLDQTKQVFSSTAHYFNIMYNSKTSVDIHTVGQHITLIAGDHEPSVHQFCTFSDCQCIDREHVNER